MKPRRTHFSNLVFRMPGGNEDQDLWVIRDEDAQGCIIHRSVWVPTDEERRRIADGANIEMIVWGERHPPVSADVVDYPLGAPPRTT